MKTKEYSFDLPGRLVAQYPADRRGESRLLVLDRASGAIADSHISQFPRFLEPGSLLVVNNSKVRKARVYAQSREGSTSSFSSSTILGRPERDGDKSKRSDGQRYRFASNDGSMMREATITDEDEDGKIVCFDTPIDETFFTACGHIPLPPYIKREDMGVDETRYQTVYAEKAGSVAAPTAGLHFTEAILREIDDLGITICPVTLHVGAGTFLPVRSEHLEDHRMHLEHYEVPEETARLVTEAKREGRKVVAVGTTSVRTLESAFDVASLRLPAGEGSTRLFILPPYKFKVVDGLLTNFHTPESTLLVLVSAFAGKDHILEAYRHAVDTNTVSLATGMRFHPLSAQMSECSLSIVMMAAVMSPRVLRPSILRNTTDSGSSEKISS